MNAASLHASDFPRRKHLPHEIPAWVEDGTTYFITICITPKSRNQLCIPQVAHRIQESMHFRQERGEWWMPLLLLMPDHLHALMGFARTPGMKRSISLWNVM
jgi:putative transposase